MCTPDGGGVAAFTWTVAVPTIEPDVAEIVASPALFAVATPVVASMVATAGALLVQVTVTATGLAAASAPVAVNDCVALIASVAVEGVTVIVASGPVTTTSASLQVPNVLA